MFIVLIFGAAFHFGHFFKLVHKGEWRLFGKDNESLRDVMTYLRSRKLRGIQNLVSTYELPGNFQGGRQGVELSGPNFGQLKSEVSEKFYFQGEGRVLRSKPWSTQI